MTYLTRLEYLTPEGWKVAHKGIELLDPKRYVERLEARQKFGRATVLDADGAATDEVYAPAKLPRFSKLVPDPPYLVPRLPLAGEAPPVPCPLCDEVHHAPYDGSCLI